MKLARVADSLRTGFWAIPTACVVVVVALAFAAVALDHRLAGQLPFAFSAGPTGARSVLSAITGSMITFTGLVFTITIVVLQLASSQFSPRVLRTFLRDRYTQICLGVFIATFTYALLVLRSVGEAGRDRSPFVPQIATTLAVVLLLASVGLFLGYIHHIATSIRVSSIIAAIGRETRAVLEKRFPPDADPVVSPGPSDVPARVLSAPRSGVLVTVDDPRLVRLAADARAVFVVPAHTGEFIAESAPLVEIHGNARAVDSAEVCRAIAIEGTRAMQQDVAFGFRQLVDIAERALSPAVNDPTTAVQVLDELHDLLRRLAVRRLPTGKHLDHRGELRLVRPAQRFEDYLRLALDEIEQYGAESIQVRQRVRALLSDVRSAALPEHRPAIDRRVLCDRT